MLRALKAEKSRNRIIYFALIILFVILVLATRKYPELFPLFIAKYGGDTLWASLIYLGFGYVFKKKSILDIAFFSLIFAYLIEISQLYQATWINEIRNTTLGGLILGFGFLWSDIICYTVGIFTGILFEYSFYKNKVINKI